MALFLDTLVVRKIERPQRERNFRGSVDRCPNDTGLILCGKPAQTTSPLFVIYGGPSFARNIFDHNRSRQPGISGHNPKPSTMWIGAESM